MSLPSRPRTSPLARGPHGLLTLGLLLSACSLPPLEEQLAELEEEEIDPKLIFAKRVKPEMEQSCSCHYTTQMGITPFLEQGNEYDKLTTYGMGRFLTAVPEQSLLLMKGKHQGPAFTDLQYYAVRGWLDVEATTRGLGKGSPTTPSVPIRDGDYFLAIDKFSKDPLSKITFTMKAGSSNAFVVTDLKISAGPSTGIKTKHPKFVFITAAGTTTDPSDSLQTVDLTVNENQTSLLGSGTLRLTGVPASAARVAMAFETIAPTVPNPPPPVCKAPELFNPAVLNTLKSCAAQCHSPQGSDPQRTASATGAFNMAAANNGDAAAQALLCVFALNRVSLADIPKSPLIRQALSVGLGGTPNHPYKLPDSIAPMFQTNVTTWATGEK